MKTEIAGENYIFVYQKFSTTKQFVATNYWEEVFESQPVPPGLHIQLDILTGKKYAKLMKEPLDQKSHVKKNESSKNSSPNNPVNSSEKTKNNLETKVTGKKESKSKDHICTRNATQPKPNKSREQCKGCKQEFTDLCTHIKRSFPCQNQAVENLETSKK